MKIAQPSVSRHLSVLRKVGVVTVAKSGQHRLYRLHAAQLKPLHDWVKTYERYWTHQLGRIKERAEWRLDRLYVCQRSVPHCYPIKEQTVHALEIVKEEESL